MKKTLKLMAMLFGVIALATGGISCKDDDDSNDCCSVSWTYYEYTRSMKICKDGDFTAKEDGETVGTGDWNDYEDSWADAKATVESESGKDCK